LASDSLASESPLEENKSALYSWAFTIYSTIIGLIFRIVMYFSQFKKRL